MACQYKLLMPREPREARVSLPALLQRQRPVCARSAHLLALHSVRDHTTQVMLARSFNFDSRKGPVNVQWFIGAETNLAYNCLDRNVEAGHGDRVAFYWEGNDLGEDSVTTYSELLAQARPNKSCGLSSRRHQSKPCTLSRTQWLLTPGTRTDNLL